MENAILITPEVLHDFCKEIASAVAEALQQREKIAIKDQIMSKKEVCEFLGIGLTTLWAWERSGMLVSFKIGRKVYYNTDDVMGLLTNHISSLSLKKK